MVVVFLTSQNTWGTSGAIPKYGKIWCFYMFLPSQNGGNSCKKKHGNSSWKSYCHRKIREWWIYQLGRLPPFNLHWIDPRAISNLDFVPRKHGCKPRKKEVSPKSGGNDYPQPGEGKETPDWKILKVSIRLVELLPILWLCVFFVGICLPLNLAFLGCAFPEYCLVHVDLISQWKSHHSPRSSLISSGLAGCSCPAPSANGHCASNQEATMTNYQ